MGVETGSVREIDERLLDEMRDEPGIGAMGQHRGRAARIAGTQRQRTLAQAIIRSRRRREAGIGITARPRLNARVEVEGALLLTERDQRDARYVDRDIEQKIAVTEMRLQYRAIVALCKRRLQETDAVLGCDIVSARLGGDDRDLIGRNLEMPEQQRQDALPDAAKADDHETSR